MRRDSRTVDGVLLLDKAVDVSSNVALQQVKRLFRADKAGHTGTLDPFASGLLLICFGEATKFAQFAIEQDKTYLATLRLGITTRTGDCEGEVIQERLVNCSSIDVEHALTRFRGEQLQRPPRFAALKYQGQPYYRYARAGIDIPLKPRSITILELHVQQWAAPQLVLWIRCSKGTYIRSLAEDIGEVLGCGAYLTALRRMSSGAHSLSAAHTLEQIAEWDCAALDALLLPVQSLLSDLPALQVSNAQANKLIQGQVISWVTAEQIRYCRLIDQNQRFFGLGELTDDQRLRPKRLLVNKSG